MTYLEKSSHFSYMQTGVYNTQETYGWDKQQPQHSKRIDFATPFEAPPKVITWLQSLDMDSCENWRIKVYPSDIDAKGFTIHADACLNTVLYSTGITWLAYPADQPGVASGTFNTHDVRPPPHPQADNWGVFRFPTAFSTTPKVIMAIDSFDYCHHKNLRLHLSMPSVTSTDMTWRLQSWADSTMYSSGASFFAWT